MSNANQINSAINSNKQMFQKMNTASNFNQNIQQANYNQIKTPQYYNDEVVLKNKKKEKVHNKSIAIVSALSGIVVGATVATSFIKGKHADVLSNFKLSKIKENISNSSVGQGTKKLWQKFMNASINFGNLRDDFARRMVEWTEDKPILKYIKSGSDEITKLYQKWSKTGSKSQYISAREDLIALYEKHGLPIPDNLKPRFNEWFDSTCSEITQRVTSDETITKSFFKKGKGLKQMGHEFVDDVIVNKDKLNSVYQKNLISLDSLPDDKELRKAADAYNKVVLDVVERLRDTNLGNAISDSAGLIAALGGLGIAIGSADNKEERKSTIINLGIPVITTLTSMVVGSVKNIAGSKSMAFGLGLSAIGTGIAKFLDGGFKNLSKKDKEEIKA